MYSYKIKKMPKTLLYPIFLKFSSKLQDNFWRFVYEDLSYGITPYGVYIQDDYICCYIKNKEFSWKIVEDNVDSVQQLHELLQKKAGILSEKDKVEKKENLKEEKMKEGKSMNKKTYRDNLIQNYIIKEGKKYEIRIDILKNLLSFLNNAFLFKVISVSDIVFNKLGEMESIKGIEFKKNKVVIKYHLFSNVTSSSISEDEVKKHNISSLWKIFLEELRF